jgi:hypothetical protein
MSSGVQVLEGSDVKYEFQDGNVIPHATTDWIYFYDPDKPNRLRMDLLHSFQIKEWSSSIRFSHGGDLLAFSDDASTHLHRASNGHLITTFDHSGADPAPDFYSDLDSDFDFVESSKAVSRICFSADDRLLAVGLFCGLITVCRPSEP